MSQNPSTTPVSSDNVISITKGGNTSPAEKEFKTWLRQLISKAPDLKVMKGMSIDEVFSLLCVVIEEEILEEDTSDEDAVKLDDVLYDKTFERSKYAAITILQKRLDAQKAEADARAAAEQQQKQAAKQSKADRLAAKALQKAGFDPLVAGGADPLKKYVGSSTSDKIKDGTKTERSSSDDVPEEVVQVLASMPELKGLESLFDEGWKAQSMRYHFVKSAKEIQGLRNDLDKDKDKELIGLYSARNRELSRLIPLVTRVIHDGWGLHTDRDHRDEWATPKQNDEMIGIIRKDFPKLFDLLCVLPKLESPEEKQARKEAEANQKKAEAHKRALYDALIKRLNEKNPDGLPDGFAERFAGKKCKMEKYQGVEIIDDLITAIFAEAAINRLDLVDSAKNDAEKEQGRKTAMFYANAAGMDEEDLETGLAEFRQQREQVAAGQSATVASQRGAKFGESTKESEKKGSEGKPSGKKRAKKGDGKSDGDPKPTAKPARGKR